MAANAGAVDHVLPVIGEAQIDQRLQQGIPHALLGPSSEADIDRVPPAISLMHIAPGAADPQHVEHAVEKATIIAGRPSPATTLRRQQWTDQLPLRIRQIPTTHVCSPKSSLESELARFGNPFCQHGLVSNTVTSAQELTVVGTRFYVERDFSTAVGNDTDAAKEFSSDFKNSAQATGEQSTAISSFPTAQEFLSVAVGAVANANVVNANGRSPTAMGVGAIADQFGGTERRRTGSSV